MCLAIETATEATDDLVAALNVLLPQLSPLAQPTTLAALRETLAQPDLTLLLARDATGAVVGTATVIIYQILTGRHARLEDVVVDEASRGLGIGEVLTQAAMELARERGARNMYLTSGHQRQAAHRLYRRLGFAQIDTGHFRMALTE